jgi:hypothetical protein
LGNSLSLAFAATRVGLSAHIFLDSSLCQNPKRITASIPIAMGCFNLFITKKSTMKIYKFLSLFFIAFTFFTFTSCRNNDDEDSSADKKGNLQIKFENGFDNLGDIVLNQTTQTSSQGQKHQFSNIKYVISNISLIDENGNEFKYNENNLTKVLSLSIRPMQWRELCMLI